MTVTRADLGAGSSASALSRAAAPRADDATIGGTMGHLEQFAQRTFAEETERITEGAAGWQDPPEIRLERVQADGFLIVRRPQPLRRLAAPWPQAQPHDEVMLELKLPRNHLDRKAVERALLRRQARQLQRLEEQDASWRGEEPLWLVAPHLPEWLEEMRQPVRFAPATPRQSSARAARPACVRGGQHRPMPRARRRRSTMRAPRRAGARVRRGDGDGDGDEPGVQAIVNERGLDDAGARGREALDRSGDCGTSL
jgi:hypothetical protein